MQGFSERNGVPCVVDQIPARVHSSIVGQLILCGILQTDTDIANQGFIGGDERSPPLVDAIPHFHSIQSELQLEMDVGQDDVTDATGDSYDDTSHENHRMKPGR